MEERREYSRAGKSSTVEFKELEFPLTDKDYLNSKIKNISGSGLLLESNKKFKIGTSLHLKISLVGWDKERPGFNIKSSSAVLPPVSIIGSVIRVKKIRKSTFYDTGIKFVNVDEDDAVGMINFLNKSMEEK